MKNSKTTFVLANLAPTQRVARALLGASLLSVAMFAPVSPLGLLALLPLIAIIPLATAITGVCPVYSIFAAQAVDSTDADLSMPAQIELGAIGAALIGTLYVIPFETLGGFTVLALLGLVPLLVALMGKDPFVAMLRRGMPAASGYIDAQPGVPDAIASVHSLTTRSARASQVTSDAPRTGTTSNRAA